MKIIIRPHDIGRGTSDYLGKTAHQWGFDGVQLAIAKAVEGYTGDPGTLTPETIEYIRKGFNENNVEIPILGAYFNPVHSNKDKVKAGAAKYADHLKHAVEFGTKYVASETGSFNDDKWTYNPKNQTAEAFKQVLDVFSPMPEIAKQYDSRMTVEGAWGHCIYCPEVMNNFVKELDNGYVNVIVDILNYLYIGNYQNRNQIFEQCFKLFKEKIVAFHLKDFVVAGDHFEEVGLGQGIMGWKDFLPIIKQECPNAILVFEGVHDVPQSLDFVRGIVG